MPASETIHADDAGQNSIDEVSEDRWIPAIAFLKNEAFQANLYSEPTIDSPLIGKIMVGDAVQYQTAVLDSWWRIRTAAIQGYIRDDDFQPIAGESPSPPLPSDNIGLFFDV